MIVSHVKYALWEDWFLTHAQVQLHPSCHAHVWVLYTYLSISVDSFVCPFHHLGIVSELRRISTRPWSEGREIEENDDFAKIIEFKTPRTDLNIWGDISRIGCGLVCHKYGPIDGSMITGRRDKISWKIRNGTSEQETGEEQEDEAFQNIRYRRCKTRKWPARKT